MKLSRRHLLPLVAGVVLATIAPSTLHAQDWAKPRLEASPRHREYVAIKHGDRTVQALVVYPEVSTKAPVVILNYGKKLPAANGELAVVGFCWGGGKSFAFAAHRHDLSAAFVFYGPGPADVSTINAPVYGFYAGNDARIGATVPGTTDAMKAAGKFYEPVMYDGAGHGFMRAGEDPGNTVPGNKTARDQGFARLVKHLKEMKPNSVSGGGEARGPSVPAKKEAICHDMGAMGGQ
jgi:carboxymethylenebutenolidase